MGWRPISDAPRDGTRIDVWELTTFRDGRSPSGRRVADAYWGLGDDGFPGWVERDGGGDAHGLEYEAKGSVCVVTHWMPIPGTPDDLTRDATRRKCRPGGGTAPEPVAPCVVRLVAPETETGRPASPAAGRPRPKWPRRTGA